MDGEAAPESCSECTQAGEDHPETQSFISHSHYKDFLGTIHEKTGGENPCTEADNVHCETNTKIDTCVRKFTTDDHTHGPSDDDRKMLKWEMCCVKKDGKLLPVNLRDTHEEEE
jgi:hypothetical protein